MTKSLSMPCHVTSLPPDPFPELARHKMRLFRFQDLEKSSDASTEPGRRSPNAAVSSGDALPAKTQSSATDDAAQVIIIIIIIMSVPDTCAESHIGDTVTDAGAAAN